MKKFLILSLALAVLLLPALTGCGPADDGDDAGGEELTKLVWGTEATFPPFESINEQGELEGFDKDLADIIGEELGVEMEVVDTAFETLFAGLESKKFDMVIAGITISADRLEKMEFSEPYFEAGQLIMVRLDYEEIEDQDDFAGKVLGVQIGTTADDILSAMQDGEGDYEGQAIDIKEIKRYDNYPLAFLDLQHGNLDAVVVDDPVGKAYAKEHDDKVRLVSDEPFVTEYTAIAFRKGDLELVDQVNGILAKIKADGRYDELVDKWFED